LSVLERYRINSLSSTFFSSLSESSNCCNWKTTYSKFDRSPHPIPIPNIIYQSSLSSSSSAFKSQQMITKRQQRTRGDVLTTMANLRLPRRQCTSQRSSQTRIPTTRCRSSCSSACRSRFRSTRNHRCTSIPLLCRADSAQFGPTCNISEQSVASLHFG
jgi:hypothetical protein